jgi:hypothetical protein
MSKYTINIGLNNPVRGVDNTVEQTLLEALKDLKGVRDVAVKTSHSERTVVIDFDVIYGSLNRLCDALEQDCVAVYDHDAGQGFLIGHNAISWGEFNIDYFLFTFREV